MNKKFSLDEYRKNPSQKIVTRDGRSVEILYTDRLSERCVIALVDGTDALYYFSNGRGNGAQGEDCEDDLFFVVDDGPEFDFEKETEELWKSIPRRTHAIYDRIKEYGMKCLNANTHEI